MRRLLVLLALICTACPVQAGEPAPSPALPDRPLLVVTLHSDVLDNCRAPQFVVLDDVLKKRLGLQYQCETLPWARAQQMVKSGQRDGMITVRTKERAFYTVSGKQPILSVENHLFTHRQHRKIKQIRDIRYLPDLRGLDVLTYLGDSWSKQNLLPLGVQLSYSESDAAALTKLAAQHGDVALQSDLHTPQLLRALKLEDQIEMLPQVLYRVDYHLLLNPKSAYVAYLPHMDVVLEQMTKDGSLNALYARLRAGTLE